MAGQGLDLQPRGAAAELWVDDALTATSFPSMREATRVAMRLTSKLRAFGGPRQSEVNSH